MRRSYEPEIMDGPPVSAELTRRFHRDLRVIHSLMGNATTIVRRLKREPPASVIDIGCGDGWLLAKIREATGARVTGIDLRPPQQDHYRVPVLQADATIAPLPEADVAVSLVTIHHMTEDQVVALFRNVGRSCKRFVCVDLVRHPLPLVLYTLFFCPLLSRIGANDGRQSIRRAFTPAELNLLVRKALEGTGASFEQWVSPIHARQIIDVHYRA